MRPYYSHGTDHRERIMDFRQQVLSLKIQAGPYQLQPGCIVNHAWINTRVERKGARGGQMMARAEAQACPAPEFKINKEAPHSVQKVVLGVSSNRLSEPFGGRGRL